MTTGTTPAGSLDDIRYLAVGYVNGFCEAGFDLRMYRTNELDEDGVVGVFIPADSHSPPTQVIAATAQVSSGSTDQVRFEVTHIDVPQGSYRPLRIAGRVTVHDGAWNLDFTIDAMTEPHTCL